MMEYITKKSQWCMSFMVAALIVSPALNAGTLDGATTADANSVAVGSDARAEGDGSVALGSSAFTFSPSSLALGAGAVSSEESGQSSAIGFSALATEAQATAVGSFAQAFGETSLAVGSVAVVEDAVGGSAFGANTLVEATGGTALGSQAEVLSGADNAVALGNNSLADQANTVSVGNSDTGLTRRITNVAQAIEDFDAVNFSQFKAGLSDVRADAFAGIAAAAAFNPAIPSAPGKTAVGVGAATYRGEQALSVSFSRRLPGASNALLNGGFAFDSSNHALGKVGVAWEF